MATYIMVLKDANGIVKLHALVNVENYSIVATGTTQADAKKAYVELLKSEGVIEEDEAPELPEVPEEETKEVNVQVSEIRIVTVAGESVIYLTGSDGNLYKQQLSVDESLLLVGEGDHLTLTYVETEQEKIHKIVKWVAYDVSKAE